MSRILLVVACLLAPLSVAAQGFPAKPIRVLVGFSPGGAPDIIARMLGVKLQEGLGQPLLVENRPGAAGNIAGDALAKSAPDGYTLLMGNVSLTISAHAAPKPPFDVRELDAVGMVASLPLMLVVHQGVPVGTVRELIEYARARPGVLNYASVGHGSAHHLSGELLSNLSGAKMVHVPYKGGGAAIQALLGQETHLLFLTPLALMPHVRSGKLKALGVTSARRTAAAPDVPTIAEAGLAGFDVDNWHTLFAPRGTPAEVVARLNGELNRVLNQAEVKQQLLAQQGAEAWPSTPEAARAHVRAEVEKWGRIVRESGATLSQ
ncbi:MAG TPA: tripartite tricarboxylate transporter substrate binding protein [Burkholderiales bacterium]|nr:tripartite tricarboxylate transporter substrate binding protein [Burkholderiales bacterium]